MDAVARTIADSILAPTLITDHRGRQLYANRAWLDLEAVFDPHPGDFWSVFVTDPDHLSRLRADFAAAEATGTLTQSLVRCALPGEAVAWWTVSWFPVREDGDEALAVGRVTRWITRLEPAIDRQSPGATAWNEREVLVAAQRIAHVGAWDWDIGGGGLWWSDEVYRICGREPQEFPATYEGFLASIHVEDRDEVQRRVEAAVAGSERYDLRHRVVRPDGSVRYVREQAVVTRTPDGTPVRMLGTIHDVTDATLAEIDQRGAHIALAASEARYRMLAENASDVVWQVGTDGKVSWVSESVTDVLGWTPRQLVGMHGSELVHPEDRSRMLAALGDLAVGEVARAEFRILQADGGTRWMAATVHVSDSGGDGWQVGALRDIQEEVNARIELEYAIGHDPLTGLATRPATLTRVATRLTQLSAARHVVAVLSVGVDSLTTINDGLTHSAGDRVLATVAARVVSAVGDSDLVGRGAGNEILVILPDLASGADAGVTADRIRQVARGAVPVAGERVDPTVSIGIATGGRGTQAEQLVRDASVALRQAKAAGPNRARFVDEPMAAEARRRLQVEVAIRNGLRSGEFLPWFQPIVDMVDGQVTGYEALMRWLRGNQAPLTAAEFIPIAERSQLIVGMDHAVLERAVAAMAMGEPHLTMAVNVSAPTLANGDYAKLVLRHLANRKVQPERLHLEVTETTLLSVTETIRCSMDQLAEAGVRWYVDDFGTGYSSISHLRDLPISGLKLDRSFTAGLTLEDDTCLNLSEALVGLADGLQLDTVAEGVETPQEAAVLQAQGWRHGQGWLFGRPAPLGRKTPA